MLSYVSMFVAHRTIITVGLTSPDVNQLSTRREGRDHGRAVRAEVVCGIAYILGEKRVIIIGLIMRKTRG